MSLSTLKAMKTLILSGLALGSFATHFVLDKMAQRGWNRIHEGLGESING